ncbi:MAG: hypothetical protein L6R37_003195 [Teloschistes peruensis]|nr:MAG: hypothetical protein L6R37_003195 [Teloschistes peruensis]
MHSIPRALYLLTIVAADQHVLASPLSFPVESPQAASVPDYVKTYAPLVWLHPEDPYFPSDIGAQLLHTKPEIKFSPVDGAPAPLTLDNLDGLNANNGANVYLTSNDDVTTAPAWIKGVKPDDSHKTEGAISCAIIVNDRGNGNVDAFYMYFYAYNWGGTLLGQDVDEHVGDWEHNMIRFANGKPTQVWYSQHAFGEAFTYDCLEKQGDRPVAYSGNGSHANYAIKGTHDHTIPNVNLPGKGILTDYTDQGTLWDPLLSTYFHQYDASSKTFTPYDPSYPTAWLNYIGKWGDEEYPDSDPRQHKIFGIDATARFAGGPTGPEDKQLNRTDVCPVAKGYVCDVRTEIGA